MTPGRVEVRARTAPRRCAVCHADVATLRSACDACGVTTHRACAGDVEGCPTLGCEGALALRVELAPWRRVAVAASLALGLLGGGLAAPLRPSDAPRDAVPPGVAAAARLATVDALGRLDPTWSRVDLRPYLDPTVEPDPRVRAVAAVRLVEHGKIDWQLAVDAVAAFETREKTEPEPLVWKIMRLGLLDHELRRPGPWVASAVEAVVETALAARPHTGGACLDLLRALSPHPDVRAALLDLLRAAEPTRRAVVAACLEPAAKVELVSYLHRSDGRVVVCREENDVYTTLVLVRDQDPAPEVRMAAAASVRAAEGRPVHSTGWFDSGGCLEIWRKDKPYHQ